MHTLKSVLIAAALAGASLAAADADARGRHHHHHRHHGHVGIWLGAPLFYPYYAYPRYYYPPAVVAAPAPPVYIEQAPSAAPAPSPQQSSGAYWYFCRDTQTYYPYVQQCATPWEQVVPNSRPQS